MTRPIACINHPMKPARCLCCVCKVGLCKYCYKERDKKYYCEKDDPGESSRGVAKIQL